MLRLTLKGLWAHKLRFLLTGLAVILGVAFMSGTMILTDTMGRTFDDVLATNNEGVDAIVRRESAIDGEMAEVRERVDEATLAGVLGRSTESTPRPARSKASPSSSVTTVRSPTTNWEPRSEPRGSTTRGSTRSSSPRGALRNRRTRPSSTAPP